MSRSFIGAGRRLTVTPTVAHSAGDLVYHNGFYGVAQDDWVVGRVAVLVMDAGVQSLKNIFGNVLAQGTKVYAAPSAIATSALIYPAGSVPSGANPIGRVIATGLASSATATLKVAMFHPNEY